jgi:hypothetical protein
MNIAKVEEKFIKFLYYFTWFSKIYYIFTMKVSQFLEQSPIPVYKNRKEIEIALRGGALYKRDNIAQTIKEYLIHPRVIQYRIQQTIPFGDCDDHAIYWCVALKKSNLVKRAWMCTFQMKGTGVDDTISGHAVCVFYGKNNKLYWCDYNKARQIQNFGDFMVQSANLYGNEAFIGSAWEVTGVDLNDTPIFGSTKRILPGEVIKI